MHHSVKFPILPGKFTLRGNIHVNVLEPRHEVAGSEQIDDRLYLVALVARIYSWSIEMGILDQDVLNPAGSTGMKTEQAIRRAIAAQQETIYGVPFVVTRDDLEGHPFSEEDELRIAYYLGEIGDRPIALDTSSEASPHDTSPARRWPTVSGASRTS